MSLSRRSAPYLLAGLVACALATLSVSDCSHSSAPRSVLQLVEVNQNKPLESDVLKQPSGGNPTVVEDAVELEIHSAPEDSILHLAPDGPYGSVTLDRYEIDFQATDAIPPVTGTLGWTVRTGETISGTLVIVPAQLKVLPPLVGLDQGGEIQAIATGTIYGHEADSNYPVQVKFTIQVDFANWSDS